MNLITDDMLEMAAIDESAYLVNHTEVLQDTVKLAQNGLALTGDTLPWQKTHDKFRFRPGEVTIWTGQNNAGKSLVMTMAAGWLSLTTKVVIASMEMPVAVTHYRMMRQLSGCENPTAQYMVDASARLGQNLWYYDQLDIVEQGRIYGMIHYAATQLGMKHIMLDSLVMCGMRPDDYSGQTDFVRRLIWLAKRLQIHIHLVAHAKKPADTSKIPDRYQIKGAGEISDMAANVIICHVKRDAEDGETNCFMNVDKQRNGDWTGIWGFWWHEQSQQWTAKPGSYLPWPNPEEHYGH